jgi:hypothetical protein
MLDRLAVVHPQTAARTVLRHGVQIREDVAFTNTKGQDNPGVRRRAEKVLDKLQAPLQQTLEPGEVVLYVVRAKLYPRVLERFLVGWLALYLEGVALIFTNRRLLQFRVQSAGAWRGSLSAAAWGDVEHARAHGWLNRYLDLKFRNNRKVRYWGFRSSDKGKLKIILPTLFAACQEEKTAAGGAVSLCPNCRAALTPQVYQCLSCKQEFRNERTLAWRAVFVPGGAYFYTKNDLFGVLTLVGESAILLSLFVSLAQAAGVIPLDPAGGRDPNPTRGGALAGAMALAVFYGIETLITFWHSRKFIREFLPIGSPGQRV